MNLEAKQGFSNIKVLEGILRLLVLLRKQKHVQGLLIPPSAGQEARCPPSPRGHPKVSASGWTGWRMGPGRYPILSEAQTSRHAVALVFEAPWLPLTATPLGR